MSGISDLVKMIDSHLADQMTNEPARPDSRGTMFVDYDGDGPPVVSYRNQRRAPTTTLNSGSGIRNWVDEGLEVRYVEPNTRQRRCVPDVHERPQAGPESLRQHDRGKPGHGKPRVEGFDEDTGFAYDYDGNCFHVHRSRPSSVESQYSEYYQLDATAYSPTTALLVVEKDLPALPSERRRRDKVVGFIDRVLKKLNDLGLMKKLKDDHRRKLIAPVKPVSTHKKPTRTRHSDQPCRPTERSSRKHESSRSSTEHSAKRTRHDASKTHRHTHPKYQRQEDTSSRRRQEIPPATWIPEA